MKYVFNPRNRQINPVTEMTHVDATLRDKVVSSELYALVCQGKVTIEDIAAMFAVGKSPEVLVKNHAAVKQSPQVQAPANTEQVPAPEEKKNEGVPDGEDKSSVDSAFSKADLWKKSQADLLILAGTVGIDTTAEGFEPTRKGLIDAILARAAAAEGKKAEAPATPAEPPNAEG